MSTEQVNTNMYGFASDEVSAIPFNFGLNAGVTTLEKFEWIHNGGKDGAEQEALEIVFKINGTDKSYRKFPVTQGFDKNNQPVTDPNSTEFREAVQTFNSVITHILHCFVNSEVLKAAFNRPIPDFKSFCEIAASVLPKDFKTIKLDIFMQYQWSIRAGQNRTFLEIPNSMKNGKWLCPAQIPQAGANGPAEWKEVKKDIVGLADNDANALYYMDGAGNRHPFSRYGRYMKGNLANQQKDGDAQQQDAAASNIAHQSAPSAAQPGSTTAGW